MPTVKVDKATADKLLALVPEEYKKRIPFFVRKHALSKTVEKIANEKLELYAVAAVAEGEILSLLIVSSRTSLKKSL